MNADRDILFLILTSHGSQEGLAVNAGRSAETLKPSNLAVMLKRTGIRYKVIVISACYSGVFITPIADADTLVITAADANHSSYANCALVLVAYGYPTKLHSLLSSMTSKVQARSDPHGQAANDDVVPSSA